MSRSRRARFRNRGKRKEALKADKELMWAKLSGKFKKVEYSLAAGYFYAPYIPFMRTDSFTIISSTTP